MLKHENVRTEEGENIEEKDMKKMEKEVLRVNMRNDIAESKRKIKLGRMMTDIAEEENMDISLLPKDKQEVIDFYEQFGQPTERRDIVEKEEDSMSEHY